MALLLLLLFSQYKSRNNKHFDGQSKIIVMFLNPSPA